MSLSPTVRRLLPGPRRSLAWFLLATAVGAAALWQAKVTLARGAPVRSHAPPTPPEKTRHALRPPPAVADPAAAFASRLRQGMTRQDIRWVLDDFHAAGLDADPSDASFTDVQRLALRAAGLRWYRSLLAEALQLDSAQKTRVTANLAQAFARMRQPTVAGDPFATTPGTGSPQLAKSYWLHQDNDPFSDQMADELRPENLCDLTPRQRLLADPGESESETDSLFSISSLPPRPLLPEALSMHPARLKFLLLAYPSLAKDLQQELDATAE